MQVSDDRFQAESGWNCSFILILLGKFLMRSREDSRNIQFHPDSLLGSGHQKPV